VAFIEKLLRSKIFVWTLLVLPGLWPAWPLFVTHSAAAGADPLKFVYLHLGFVACVLLATVLAFTPLRVLFPKSKPALALNRHRRLVGVASFAYALLHLTAYLLHEGGFRTLVHDTYEKPKPFILAGLAAFTILLVLAITSLHAFVRWLGGKRWKNLHRLAYLAAALAAYHQIYARKLFPVQVLWIFGPLALLEIARIVRQRQLAAARAKPVA
jgi:sulfoxide reductase heme-binding subunit YedZ